MKEWPTKTLGQLCREGGGFIRTGPFGSQLHRSDYIDDRRGIPVVMPKDMARGRIDTSTIARIDEATANRLEQHLLTANDVVLSRRGDVGRTAWVFADDLPAFCGTGSIRVHPGESNKVRPAYLRFFFHTRMASDYLKGHAVGATMPNLNAGIVERMPVPVPPIPVQDSLIATLGAFDELIENSRRRVEVLEESARTIYREWFVKFRYPGHEDVPLVDSSLGRVPAGWTLTTLGNAAEWFSGGTPRTTVAEYWGGMLPWITSGTLTSMLLDRSDRMLTEVGASNGTRVVERDALLFVVRGMSLAKEFRVGIADTRVAFGQDVKALIASPDIEPMYLAFSVISRADEIQRMVEFAGHGTGKLSTDRLKAIEIPKPPQQVQASFTDAVNPLRESMSALRLSIDYLEALRDLLLPKFVTGQLDISKLDPAALLGDQVA